MTDRLKPCPLCDGEAEWKNGHIICKKCGLRFRDFSYDLTNKKWNTRKPMDRIVEALEEGRNFYLNRYEKYLEDEDRSAYESYEDAIEIVKEGGKK